MSEDGFILFVTLIAVFILLWVSFTKTPSAGEVPFVPRILGLIAGAMVMVVFGALAFKELWNSSVVDIITAAKPITWPESIKVLVLMILVSIITKNR